MRTICLHGPESVGKSVLAPQLAAHFNTAFVPEYGRTYCEQHGTELVQDDLVHIAKAQCAMAMEATERANQFLILDTDPLMTAVWSDMMLGARDPWFADFKDVADLYLFLDIDLPWISDGTRIYGEGDQRAEFFERCRNELVARGVKWALISGSGEARMTAALAAITRVFPDL